MERRKLSALSGQLRKEFSPEKLFWYKIPDSYGGQKRPFDVIGVFEKTPFAIEFKGSKNIPTDEQRKNLLDFYGCSGRRAYIGTFFSGVLIFSDVLGKRTHTVHRQGGRYLCLDELLYWLIEGADSLRCDSF